MLKGLKQRLTQTLSFLRVPSDGECFTLPLGLSICPPHREQYKTLEICTQTGIERRRRLRLVRRLIRLHREGPGSLTGPEDVYTVQPVRRPVFEELRLPFGNHSEHCR